MLRKGSCHGKTVRFTLRSHHTPVRYMHCDCPIRRNTAGGAGAAIRTMGEADPFKAARGANVALYRLRLSPRTRTRAPRRRHFCRRCGWALSAWDLRGPQRLCPFVSAIDSTRPAAPDRQHICLGSTPPWMLVPKGPRGKHSRAFAREAIRDRHRRRGLLAK